MAAWDRDKGQFGGIFSPKEDPKLAAAEQSAAPRPWYQTFRRLTEEEKAEKRMAEWKAARAKSIL
ncbi:hypothetical protein NKH85_16305 [Mesorhizobium sp. M0924]|uniref:hypothetical protein n=1 Tax=unclassified Mesorhizobium TaxID=325217 RepID=UPI00333E00D3